MSIKKAEPQAFHQAITVNKNLFLIDLSGWAGWRKKVTFAHV